MASQMSSEELERQFNPRVTVPDFQQYLDRAAAASRQARATYPALLDVRYGPGPRQLVDIFPAEDPEAPALVFVHGGFWRALSKDAFSGLAGALRPQGITTVLVGYDLCPTVTLDALVDEITDAIAWSQTSLVSQGLRPRRLVLAGTSAGAHLIAMALSRRSVQSIDGVCLVSGIYDLAPVLRISVNTDIQLDESSARRNSPLHFLPRLHSPIVVAVGALESDAWRQQSAAMAKHCIDCGTDTRFVELPAAHHFSTGLAVPGSTLNKLAIELCLRHVS